MPNIDIKFTLKFIPKERLSTFKSNVSGFEVPTEYTLFKICNDFILEPSVSPSKLPHMAPKSITNIKNPVLLSRPFN